MFDFNPYTLKYEELQAIGFGCGYGITTESGRDGFGGGFENDIKGRGFGKSFNDQV